MSTANPMEPAGTAPTLTPEGGTALGVTQVRVIRSEWVKFRSLRSTWWSIGITLLVSIGLSILVSYLRGRDMQIHDYLEPDQTALSLRGFYLAQLAVGVLGVLFVTGEYGTGMIRATLTAAPKRLPVWVAKAVVFTAMIFALCLVASFIAFLGGQAVLHHYSVQGVWQTVQGHQTFVTCGTKGAHAAVAGLAGQPCPGGSGGSTLRLGVSLGSTGALRAVFGAALYMVGIGLLAMGCGWLIRNTGGAIAALFGLVLVLPLLAEALPTNLNQDISKFLPLNAGTAVMNTVWDSSTSLSPWAGIGVFAIYAVLAMVAGLVVLRRRDA